MIPTGVRIFVSIAAGITYARNQRVALQRFVDDGRLPAHNNLSELHLRRQASPTRTTSSTWCTYGPTRARQAHDLRPADQVPDFVLSLKGAAILKTVTRLESRLRTRRR
jgi:hypothetical protein